MKKNDKVNKILQKRTIIATVIVAFLLLIASIIYLQWPKIYRATLRGVEKEESFLITVKPGSGGIYCDVSVINRPMTCIENPDMAFSAHKDAYQKGLTAAHNTAAITAKYIEHEGTCRPLPEYSGKATPAKCTLLWIDSVSQVDALNY